MLSLSINPLQATISKLKISSMFQSLKPQFEWLDVMFTCDRLVEKKKQGRSGFEKVN